MKTKNPILIRQITILFLCALLSFSCDAPKNNPLGSDTNTTPIVTEFNVYSIVFNTYTLPRQQFQVVVQARITDRSDMVDTVFINIPYFKARKRLDFNSQEHFYEKTLTLIDLRTQKPDELIGQTFNLQIKDIKGRLYEGRIETIKRLIKDNVEVDNPLNGDTTEANPVLKWKEFGGGFTHNYMVQIFTNEGIEGITQLVWQKENIPSDSLSTWVDVQLSKGSYIWYVWCVDQFKNRARSRSATFNVK